MDPFFAELVQVGQPLDDDDFLTEHDLVHDKIIRFEIREPRVVFLKEIKAEGSRFLFHQPLSSIRRDIRYVSLHR